MCAPVGSSSACILPLFPHLTLGCQSCPRRRRPMKRLVMLALFASFRLAAQEPAAAPTGTVIGQVVNAETKAPLAAATVLVAGTSLADATNAACGSPRARRE